MDRTYSMPDGTTTIDPDEYADAWIELTKPLCAAMGWRFAGLHTPFIYFEETGHAPDLGRDLEHAILQSLVSGARRIELSAAEVLLLNKVLDAGRSRCQSHGAGLDRG